MFHHKANLHVVLEFLDSDLEQVIQDKRIPFLSPADVKSWTLMALRGLHHCHVNWVLHRVRALAARPPPAPHPPPRPPSPRPTRTEAFYCIAPQDIKPNNMLLAANGQLKLADFGLAKRYADPTVPMTPTVVTLYARGPCTPRHAPLGPRS